MSCVSCCAVTRWCSPAAARSAAHQSLQPAVRVLAVMVVCLAGHINAVQGSSQGEGLCTSSGVVLLCVCANPCLQQGYMCKCGIFVTAPQSGALGCGKITLLLAGRTSITDL